ncbi:MAG: DUF4339 domain-containing protein [Magnetococcales bacterium]|nr:DUF4339 domain-containing protein [Magnetococcales bacterium]
MGICIIHAEPAQMKNSPTYARPRHALEGGHTGGFVAETTINAHTLNQHNPQIWEEARMQEEWWYTTGDNRMGPISLDALRQLLLEGKVAQCALVWKEGFANWTPLSEIPNLQQVVRALPPDLSACEQVIALTKAGPWRRFFARLVDLWVIALPASSVVAFALSYSSPAFGLWIQRPGSEYAFGWLLLPLVLLLEAGIFAMFGTTIGKSLLSVVVTTVDGQRPTTAQYLQRQLGVYWFGLGTGFPLVSFFTMARQHARLKSGRYARYDEGKFNVKATKLGLVRVLSVTAVVVTLLLINATLQQLSNTSKFEESGSAMSVNQATDKSAILQRLWKLDQVQEGDTLSKILERHGVIRQTAIQTARLCVVVAERYKVVNLVQTLRVGGLLKLSFDHDNRLTSLQYSIDDTHTLQLTRKDDGQFASHIHKTTSESVEVLGQRLVFSNPDGYCTLGASERELAWLELARRSLGEDSRLVHAAVSCSELEDYRKGRREMLDHWLQIHLIGVKGNFQRIEIQREAFLSGLSKSSPRVNPEEINRRLKSSFHSSDINLSEMKSRPIGWDRNAVYFPMRMNVSLGGSSRPVTGIIGITLLNSLPLSINVYEGTGYSESRSNLQSILFELLNSLIIDN